MSQVHPQARTTPRTRAEIKASAAPVTELAERYNMYSVVCLNCAWRCFSASRKRAILHLYSASYV